MNTKKFLAGVAFVLFGSAHSVHAGAMLSRLLSFNQTNGDLPVGGLISDASGNLYGTSSYGGTSNAGTLFELSGPTHQTMSTLVNFTGGFSGNGDRPEGNLVADSAGNLYGTTYYGGYSGQGSVYELSGADHKTVTTLYSFTGLNGNTPLAGLAIDSAGDLFGTTPIGGSNNYGSVFELSGTNHQSFTTLISFNNTNGKSPFASLTLDAAGNLYGTTQGGGAFGDGTVFELSGPTHQILTTLVNFNGTTGANPYADLIVDALGNLFGTTQAGGTLGNGTVFEISGSQHQTFTTLVNLDGADANPYAGLLEDKAGNLFGTSYNGNTIFELSGPNYQTFSTVIHFNGTAGAYPYSDLIADAAGNLYGTTQYGGSSQVGAVFEVTGSGFIVPEPSNVGSICLAAMISLASARRCYHRRT